VFSHSATKHAFLTKADYERLYEQYTRREFVHPDPLEFLYDYPRLADREIVGLIAASLAYGNVKQILRSVRDVLNRIGPPEEFVRCSTPKAIQKRMAGFKHRFATGEHMAALLEGVKAVLEREDSLRKCFLKGMGKDDATILPGLVNFYEELNVGARGRCGHLLADPSGGSACKRFVLFLRWMVRKDNVDPGGWERVGAHRLIMPLDVHIKRICTQLRLTNRNQADMKAALEITEAFRRISPDDPVKYDFALARLGIRHDADIADFLAECAKRKRDVS
jgi:uncharacterized protein (TIGR02757 family)